jgi:hypothetical protein
MKYGAHKNGNGSGRYQPYAKKWRSLHNQKSFIKFERQDEQLILCNCP